LQGTDIPVHDMGIYLGGLDVGMAEEILKDADIHPIFQEMGGETMAQGMAADLFMDPGLERGPLDGLLQAGFQDMMAHFLAGTRITGTRPCGKDPLPGGLPGRIGVFAGQGLGDVNLSETSLQVPVMEGLHRFDLGLEFVADVLGKNRGPVLTALATSDKDEVLTEIDILDAETDALHQTKTTAVKETRHKEVLAIHGGKQVPDLGAREDGGRPDLAFASDRSDFPVQGNIENFAVQKNQGVQGLTLGGCRDLANGRQVRQKAFNFPGSECIRVGLAAEVVNVAKNPLTIGQLGPIGVVVVTKDLFYLVHEPETLIRSEFRLAFHNERDNISISG